MTEQQSERDERLLAKLLAQGFDNSSRDDENGGVFVHCSQCAAAVISGVACHEHGCPNQVFQCAECGAMDASRRGGLCDGCAFPEPDEPTELCPICGELSGREAGRICEACEDGEFVAPCPSAECTCDACVAYTTGADTDDDDEPGDCFAYQRRD